MPDEPNIEDKLTSAQLKEKFDAPALAIQQYLNEKVQPAVNEVTVSGILPNSVYIGGNKSNSDRKTIYFSAPDNATYPHDACIYGGNGAKRAALGAFDYKNNHDIFWYYDTTTYTPTNMNVDISGRFCFDDKVLLNKPPVLLWEGSLAASSSNYVQLYYAAFYNVFALKMEGAGTSVLIGVKNGSYIHAEGAAVTDSGTISKLMLKGTFQSVDGATTDTNGYRRLYINKAGWMIQNPSASNGSFLNKAVTAVYGIM